MESEQELWCTILECNRQNNLGEKLVDYLENYKWSELEEIILFYKKIKFLYDFSKEYDKQDKKKREEDKIKNGQRKRKITLEKYMNYSKVYDAGVYFGGQYKTGNHLKNIFYETIDSLGFKTFQNCDSTYSILAESLIEFFCNVIREDETPMQGYLRWRGYEADTVKEKREDGDWWEAFFARNIKLKELKKR